MSTSKKTFGQEILENIMFYNEKGKDLIPDVDFNLNEHHSCQNWDVLNLVRPLNNQTWIKEEYVKIHTSWM